MERIPIKYKPKTLSDFFRNSNNPIESILRTFIANDQLLLMFTGNEYCGKTTLLGILVREYYELQNDDIIPETDIMFLNNLKEQGISFFRSEMKTHCQSACSIFGKKKMIIIDDIDFINEQSQQIFRNYIDKYKHKIHFISVCTNIQKVIESFQSRVNIIQLSPPTTSQLSLLLEKITKIEHIRIDSTASTFLLRYCQKSFCLLLNQLEKFYLLDTDIDYQTCISLCSEISCTYFEEWLNYIHANNLQASILSLYDLYNVGYSVIDIYEYLYRFIISTELLKDDDKYTIIPVFCKYITIFHTIHEDVIELALFTNEILLLVNTKQKSI
jgi:DNA polymerase III delta prime subunit